MNISNVKIAILPLRAEREFKGGGGVVAWKRRTLGSIYAQ